MPYKTCPYCNADRMNCSYCNGKGEVYVPEPDPVGDIIDTFADGAREVTVRLGYYVITTIAKIASGGEF